MSDTPQKDILDEILDQNPAYAQDGPGDRAGPAGTGEAPPPPQPPADGETPPQAGPADHPPTDRGKGKNSPVYVYLLVLFAAAFVLLLLAYFVQQRSNEHTISDLRASMNLSREQLLEAIDGLEADKEALEKQLQATEDARTEAENQVNELEQQVEYIGMRLESADLDREKGQMLAWLERFVREGDYLMAAVGIESFNRWYDWNWVTPPTDGQPPLPGQQARYRELRQEVLDRSDYLIAEPNPRATEDNPLLWISLAEDQFGPGEQMAATRLWNILWYSTSNLGTVALNVQGFYGDEALMNALENGAFRPSTRTLLEQLKDDLIRQGRLEENEDGTLTAVVLYGDNDWTLLEEGTTDVIITHP